MAQSNQSYSSIRYLGNHVIIAKGFIPMCKNNFLDDVLFRELTCLDTNGAVMRVKTQNEYPAADVIMWAARPEGIRLGETYVMASAEAIAKCEYAAKSALKRILKRFNFQYLDKRADNSNRLSEISDMLSSAVELSGEQAKPLLN